MHRACKPREAQNDGLPRGLSNQTIKHFRSRLPLHPTPHRPTQVAGDAGTLEKVQEAVQNPAAQLGAILLDPFSTAALLQQAQQMAHEVTAPPLSKGACLVRSALVGCGVRAACAAAPAAEQGRARTYPSLTRFCTTQCCTRAHTHRHTRAHTHTHRHTRRHTHTHTHRRQQGAAPAGVGGQRQLQQGQAHMRLAVLGAGKGRQSTLALAAAPGGERG